MEYDYYILKTINLVEPMAIGPFATMTEASEKEEEYLNNPDEKQNGFYIFSITKGAEIII